MRHNTITYKHTIFINRPREAVWDFTQDYSRRKKWDPSVLDAEVLKTVPQREVRLKLRGNTTMTFVYKLDDRPNKTTLVARDVKSPLMESGGGSWSYEVLGDGTRWTQTNTLVLKRILLLPLVLILFHWIVAWQTRQGMQRAKKMLEAECEAS